MSDTGGEDNPAFTNDDECPSPSTLENSHTESVQQEQHTNNSGIKDQDKKRDGSKNDPGKNDKSFVSQHYVEPIHNGTESHSYKTETRIELPANNNEKNNVTSPPSSVKVNGVNGNGNNNDASFLNTTATSIQTNDGKKEQIEAVNLELVSMRPYTGNNLQTKGQEACEVPTDPYEEYFVPVNEHRKYMRGEKLYVTKDKRSRSSYWRRVACWGCGLLVLAIALIIAILAGTGVILTQEATQPLETEGQMSSQPFNDITVAGSQEFVKNPPASPPPETSTSPPWQTTDETIFETVPEALDGNMLLNDFTWIDDLADPKSRVYRDVTDEIEKHLREILHPSSNIAIVKVYNISDNGQVLFRISYPPTPTPEAVQESMEKALRNNGNMIGKYHLGKLNVKRLINECQYNNLDCSETCRFDYTKGIFACACSPGKMFDSSGKNCIDENDLSDIEMDKNMPEPSTESAGDVVQGRSRAPESAFDPRRPEDWMHEHSGIVGESTDKPDVEIEPLTEPKSEPEPDTDEPKSQSKSTMDSEPSVVTISEPQPSAEPKLESEPSAEPTSEPEPSAEPKSEPGPSAESESEAEPSSEPKSEPEPSTEFKSEPESSAEPISSSQSVSSMDPKSEPETSTKSILLTKAESSGDFSVEPEPPAESTPSVDIETSIQPKTEAEPSAEPKSEPEPLAVPESLAIPQSEPESSAKHSTSTESTSESDSSMEAKNSAESESATESIMRYNPIEPDMVIDTKSDEETSAEPGSSDESNVPHEPASEPKSMIKSVPGTESMLETSTEPIIDPEIGGDSIPEKMHPEDKEHGDHSSHEQIDAGDTEISTESSSKTILETTQPTAEPEAQESSAGPTPDPRISTDSNSKPTAAYESTLSNKTITESSTQPTSYVAQETGSTLNPDQKSTDESAVRTIVPLSPSDKSSTANEDFSTRAFPTEQTMGNTTIETRSKLNPDSIEAEPDMEIITTTNLAESASETESDSEKSEVSMDESTTVSFMANESELHGNHSIDDVPTTEHQDLSEMNITELAPSTVLPNNIANVIESVTNSNINSTKLNHDEHVMLIPMTINQNREQEILDVSDAVLSETLPELMNDTTKFNVSDENSTFSSTETAPATAPEISNSSVLSAEIKTDRNIERTTEKMDTVEEKHAEDMSPFLPDIVKEKEMTKSPPRLDKDEQDFPNPFDPHVEDVVIHHLHNHDDDDDDETVNTTSTVSPSNVTEETSEFSNEVHTPNGAQSKTTNEGEEVTIENSMTTPLSFLADSPVESSKEKDDDDYLIEKPKSIETVGIDKEHNHLSSNPNSLNNQDAQKDDLKLSQNVVNKTTEASSKEEKIGNSLSVETQSNATLSPKNLVPGVVALEDTNTDTRTTEVTTSEKFMEILTTESIPITTSIPDTSNTEEIDEPTNKPEQNVVEDQYNDIGEENVFKNSHIDNEVSGDAQASDISSKSEFESSTLTDVKETTNPATVTVETTRMMVDSTTIMPELSASPSDSGSATVRDVSDIITTTDIVKSENNTVTTEIPIIPIEILQDMSTTEMSMKTETSATMVSNEMIRDSGNTDKESSTEFPIPMTTQMSSLETKTTAQVPILPEELQTTESEFSVTTSSTMSSVDGADRSGNKISSLIPPTTTDNVATVESGTLASTMDSQDDKANGTMPADGKIIEKPAIDASDRIDSMTNIDSVTMTSSDIKPVSEMVLDDPEPVEFNFKQLFTTTEQPATITVPNEEDEEALRVIPLEESEEFNHDSMETPATVQVVKKDANSEENDNTSQTESMSSTTPKFILTDTEGNIITVPKLKIVEVTSVSEQPVNTNVQEPRTNKITLSADQVGDGEVLENNTMSNSSTPHVRQHPIIIPVYEEIEEESLDPRMHPIIYARETSTISKPQEPKVAGTEVISPLPVEESRSVNSTDPITMPNMTPMSKEVSPKPVDNEATTVVPEMKNHETTNTTLKTANPTDEFSFPSSIPRTFYSKCTTGQFQCVNGTSRDGAYCVSGSAKCDSERDCSDGSDEENCESEHCLNNFQCKSGQCLARHLVCNGIKDCGDGSDESDCNEWTCNFDEFRCPNGRCIPDLWRCDGRPDCEDHRDEYSCSESCGNDEYLCQAEKWCIPQTWRCNGVSECADGEDEKLCDCSLEQFKCQTGGCIAIGEVCDGIEHCPDRSDEWNCLVANLTIFKNETVHDIGGNGIMAAQPTPLKIRQSNNERRLVCSEGWNNQLSNSYCQSLGFSGAESTQTVVHQDGQKVLKLSSAADSETNLVSKLQPVDNCDSGNIVEISCREFTCGAHETEGPTARLVGGTTAGEGQWSSVALLKELKHGVACTASVLGPMHALASYSCIHRLRQSSSWELFTGRDLQKSTAVKMIIPYPQVKYNQFLYSNDIALIELAEPLVFSRNVSAVCLPTQPFQPRALCVTAGWGFAANGEVNLKQYLKFLPVPTYDSEECNATSHYAGFITKDNICAGFTDADKGSCYNDEGAPLMCATESGKWEIYGLLSHHSRCSKVHPAIYSSLNPALSWLRNSVPALQIQT